MIPKLILEYEPPAFTEKTEFLWQTTEKQDDEVKAEIWCSKCNTSFEKTFYNKQKLDIYMVSITINCPHCKQTKEMPLSTLLAEGFTHSYNFFDVREYGDGYIAITGCNVADNKKWEFVPTDLGAIYIDVTNKSLHYYKQLVCENNEIISCTMKEFNDTYTRTYVGVDNINATEHLLKHLTKDRVQGRPAWVPALAADTVRYLTYLLF